MIQLFKVLALVFLASGCTDNRTPELPPDQGVVSDRVDQERASDSTAPSLEADSLATKDDPAPAVVAADDQELMPTESSVVGDPGRQEALVRDLAAELNDAVGSLEDCIQNPSMRTAVLMVTASATVRSSGEVIHPTVSATGLSQAERQCIAGRVGAIRLGALDSESPQRIEAVLEIEFAAAREPSKYQVGAPDPELRNVRGPKPPRPEVAPSGRAIQEPTSRPIQDPTSRPIQEPASRRVRGPQPRPIDGWDVDEGAKEWRD